MAKRSRIGMRRIVGHDVQLVEETLWHQAMTRENDTRNPVGYYLRDERRCYIRYDVACTEDDKPFQQQIARTDCASTIAHEMLHHASGNGLSFSVPLDEAITEWLNQNADISSAIRETVGLGPIGYSYEEERKMWEMMRKNEPRVVNDLVRCYWAGDSVEAASIIRRNFGAQILKALSKVKPAPSKVIRLINGN